MATLAWKLILIAIILKCSFSTLANEDDHGDFTVLNDQECESLEGCEDSQELFTRNLQINYLDGFLKIEKFFESTSSVLEKINERLGRLENSDREVKEKLQLLENSDGELKEKLQLLENSDGELKEKLQLLENSDGEVKEKLQLLENSDGELKEKLQLLENSDGELKEKLQLLENSDGELKEKLQLLENSDGELKEKLQLLENSDGELKEKLQLLENSDGEVKEKLQLLENSDGEVKEKLQLLENSSNKAANSVVGKINNRLQRLEKFSSIDHISLMKLDSKYANLKIEAYFEIESLSPPIKGASFKGSTTNQIADAIPRDRALAVEILNFLDVDLTDYQLHLKHGSKHQNAPATIASKTSEIFTFKQEGYVPVGRMSYRIGNTALTFLLDFYSGFRFAVGLMENWKYNVKTWTVHDECWKYFKYNSVILKSFQCVQRNGWGKAETVVVYHDSVYSKLTASFNEKTSTLKVEILNFNP